MDDADDETEEIEEVKPKEVTYEEFASIAAQAVKAGVDMSVMPVAFNGSRERLKLWAKGTDRPPPNYRDRIAFWLRAAILVKKERPQKAKA